MSKLFLDVDVEWDVSAYIDAHKSYSGHWTVQPHFCLAALLVFLYLTWTCFAEELFWLVYL